MLKKINSDSVIEEMVGNGKKIIIYGAGRYGQTLKKYLETRFCAKVSNFVVSASENIIEKEVDGMDILGVDEAAQYETDCNLVVAVSEQHQKSLINIALNHGFTNIYAVLNEFLKYMELEMNDNHLTPLSSLKFEVHITDHCNLNCKGCYHFSPLSEESFLSVEEFKKDMEQMKKLCGNKVSMITLLGGEPLLHPEIAKFLEAARNQFSHCKIKLLTNGTLLEKMYEEFWRSCQDNHITLFCTKYPIRVDYTRIEEKARKYSLNVMYHNDVNAGEKTLIKYPFDISGSQSPEWNYPRCSRSNNCITLKHGRLFTCPMAAHAHLAKDFFGLNIDLSEADSIDIYKACTFEELTSFLTKPIPFCKYCNLKIKPEQQEWKVSKKQLEEWF